ncbi:NADH-quinone oxidoreductase subunit C [Helicobacter sp. MIT 11-5569]|uniref:NADH-quinone oxidoreductase subunit C n=1 Tax=Helicobacter sp. MIT 11-5569 TaxID=1548151 RepID=UPI000B306E4C|nr:NADH-quinone oxidoreductase subunit C [Helicobacter sp. MIT 11-5569]
MREYKPKKNAQKQVNYKDRFYVSPKIPRESIESDNIYLADVEILRMQIKVMESYIERGTLVVWVEKDSIFKALEILKGIGYDVLSELSAMDYLESKGGFEIFYQLLSIQKVKRLRVKTFLKKNERIESVSRLFSSANWSEREMYDMFGILPLNHPYPKRIIMPDDWVGHPLLKSYPLQGDEAAQWYEVDTIFGKEYREVIGAEQREPARVDRYDSKRFSHLGYEVGYGQKIEKGAEKPQPITYQEEDGVLFVKKLTPESTKELKERK